MSTVTWDSALQGVSPITGGQPLPPATYRLRIIGGEGKNNSNNAPMLSLQFEVASGPLAGRKAFHNENMPSGNTDQDKQRMGYFLGLMEAFGISGQQLGQMFAGQPISKESLDYLAKALVQQGQTIKGTCRTQKNDETRINWGGWTPDDGIEPEPPKQVAAQNANPVGPPLTPNGFAGGPPNIGGAPAGLPQGGFPPNVQQQVPAAQANGLPLGGFPGSGGMQPNPAPDWATQQPVQGQPPQQLPGPGQTAPAAQPQAAGMNQFAQPGAAQFPPMGQQQPAQQQEGFPGQQFPGQVNPANFPPQNQAQQGFQPPAGLPGGTPPQQGFQPAGQPPQANI